MAARPVATAATIGTANPVISTVEDITSFGLSVTAIFVPVLGFVLVIALMLFLFWVMRGVKQRLSARRS